MDHNGHQIWIDSSLLKSFSHSKMVLYQIIGELVIDPEFLGTAHSTSTGVEIYIVKAKIIRNMQSFDLRLFDLVLKEKRISLRLNEGLFTPE